MTPTPDARRGVAARAATLLRDRYFLWWRLSVRIVEAATLVALGRGDHGIALAAATACAFYDVGLASWLRRTGRLALGPRLVLDSADVAVWSQAIGTSPDVAALAATPLAMEAAMRYGWRGVIVPAVVGGVTTAVRLVGGEPPALAPFLWPLVATSLTALVNRYLRLRLDRRLRQAGQEIEAVASRAELAGQNDVAAGADTVVDLLTRTTPLLSASGALLPPSPLAGWKLALAEASAGHTSYLGVRLSRWQRRRNSMSPDLRSDVELRCEEGAGTLLLSAGQSRALDTILDELPLTGTHTVAVPSPAPLGREQVLLLSGRRVVVPADARPAAPSLDPGPIVLLLGAASVLTHSPPRSEAVPLQVTIPLAAAACALVLWAHRHVDRRGAAAHASVLVAALLLGAADAVLSTVTMRNPVTDHLTRFPYLLFLLWFGPLFVVYWRDVARPVRWLTIGGAGAAIATAFSLLHTAPSPGEFLAAAVWPASTIMASFGVRDMLEQDERDVAADLARRQRAAADTAYRRGQRLVIDLVAAAAAEARDRYRSVRAGMPDAVAAEFERRLAEVEGRLEVLRRATARGPGRHLDRDERAARAGTGPPKAPGARWRRVRRAARAPGAALAALTAAGVLAAVAAGMSPVAAAAAAGFAGVLGLRLLQRGFRPPGATSLSAGPAILILVAIPVLVAWGDGAAVALAGMLAVSLLLYARSHRPAADGLPAALAAIERLVDATVAPLALIELGAFQKVVELVRLLLVH